VCLRYVILLIRVVDDASPIVAYSGQWTDSVPGADTVNYKDNSFHSSDTNSSSATLIFTGTSIFVFGSQGPDHGKFAVILDGSTQVLDAFNTSDGYQKALFSQGGLALGQHNVTIVNLVQDASRPWFYLDYFEFETGLDDDIANASFNMDDSNSTIVYSPATAWTTTNQHISEYYDDTLHESDTSGASISTHFAGNAISIFGGVDPSYGVMDVTIDGNKTTRVNCSSSAFRAQTLLFYSSDFFSGWHSLTMQIPTNSTKPIDLDYLTITRWSDNNGLGGGKALTPIIAGSICGSIILLAWCTYLVHWSYLQWRKRKHTSAEMRKAADTMILQKEKRKGSQGL